jgi:cell division GTPase FtsZ
MSEERNKIAVYACGGTGIALVSQVLKKNLSELAKPVAYFADTSKSDLTSVCNNDNTYLVNGTDGGGKDRAVNYEAITRCVPDLLVKHPPTDLNIIVFSAGGATGSTMGPTIAEEIWAQGKDVIFFMVGSHENATTTRNSVNSWASVNGLAKDAGKLAVVSYDNNGNASMDADVDESVIMSIISVLDLYSGKHVRLDSTDVRNWARPKTDASIALLEITPSLEVAKETPYPLSVASLMDSVNKPVVSLGADYGCDGYRRTSGPGDLYFIISTNGIDKIIGDLQKEQKRYTDQAESRKKLSTNSLDNLGGNAKKNGMVL